MFWMSKSINVSSRSNLGMLCCLQCSNSCATSWHGNGTIGLWRLPYFINVHSWSHECPMFMLSHCQFGHGSKSGGTCKLWELQDVTNVSIWSKICKMCSLQFCHISWGSSKCCNRTKIQQLKLTLHFTTKSRNYKFYNFGLAYYKYPLLQLHPSAT